MYRMFKFLLLSLVVCFINSVYAVQTNSPVGTWKTIDDVTHQPKAVIRIYESGSKLYGHVVKIFPSPGTPANPVCIECSGSRHNQPIIGMVVLAGLGQESSDTWSGGTILDPKNGKTYSATVQVTNGGRELQVRGYVGIRALGRTQTWLRLS